MIARSCVDGDTTLPKLVCFELGVTDEGGCVESDVSDAIENIYEPSRICFGSCRCLVFFGGVVKFSSDDTSQTLA